MSHILTRRAFTLLELLVVIGIIGLLVSLAIPAVQKVRDLAARNRCGDQTRQLALAFQQFHGERDKLPMGNTPLIRPYDYPHMSWLTRLLPYIEQDKLWQQAVEDYTARKQPFRGPPHRDLSVPITLFTCPSDPRGPGPYPAGRVTRQCALTSYLGINGTHHSAKDGVLFLASTVRFGDVSDGLSMTLLIGERPPGTDFNHGWWYASVGMEGTGAPDFLVGAREMRTTNTGGNTGNCPTGPFHFEAAKLTDQCAIFHNWSLHPGGAHFAMCDGSDHFLNYSADKILPALATRAGGETVEVP